MRYEIVLTTAFVVFACRSLTQILALDEHTGSTGIAPTDLPDMDLMAATQKLLHRGNLEIKLEPGRKDVTLLLGLSGSGKSTMSQLISGDEGALIAYKSGRFDTLIKDSKKKISEGSNTLKSQTLFPELIVDLETNETFYDCPGFQDTRTTPIEIANGFFMKKLVGHAKKIKLLVVAKYDGLKTGGSRAWFPNLMIQLFSFVKSFKNYKGGIALLATKVDVAEDEIKERIADFLVAAKEHVLEKLPGREEDVQILYDSWLKQDADEKYINMEYFMQPKLGKSITEQLLRSIPEVNANRDRIRQMIFNNTHFQHLPCNPSDFGIPLSDKAVSQIQKIEIKLRDDINKEHNKMASAIRQEFGRTEASSMVNVTNFEIIMKAARQVQVSDTPDHLSAVMVNMLGHIGLANVTSEIAGLTEKVNYRKYLDELQSKQGRTAAFEYSELLKAIVLEIAMNVELKVRSLIGDIVNEAFDSVKTNVDKFVRGMKERGLLESLGKTVSVINGCTLNSADFKSCVSKILELNSNQRTIKFGLKTDNLEKAAKLEALLSNSEDWAEPLKKTTFLRNLHRNLELLGVHVGSAAGITKMFPKFGDKCAGKD